MWVQSIPKTQKEGEQWSRDRKPMDKIKTTILNSENSSFIFFLLICPYTSYSHTAHLGLRECAGMSRGRPWLARSPLVPVANLSLASSLQPSDRVFVTYRHIQNRIWGMCFQLKCVIMTSHYFLIVHKVLYEFLKTVTTVTEGVLLCCPYGKTTFINLWQFNFVAGYLILKTGKYQQSRSIVAEHSMMSQNIFISKKKLFKQAGEIWMHQSHKHHISIFNDNQNYLNLIAFISHVCH